MKAKLEHGAEFEFVTPGELRSILAERELGGPERAWPEQSITLDGSGNGTLYLYSVPVDRTFTLHRLIVTTDTATPTAPFQNASGYALIQRNGQLIDFVSFSATAGGLPAVATWGNENGPHYASREKIEIVIVGGPVSAALIVRGQGTLYPPPAGS